MKKVAFVVISCDSYSDVWEYYCILFRRFWKDCPFDTFIASNNLNFDKYGFKPLLIGEDISWSNGLKVALEQIKEKGYDYIIPAFDDLLIVKEVKTNLIYEAMKSFWEIEGNCLRFDFHKCPKIKRFNQYFGEIYNYVPYRLTTGFALWKIDTLLSLIDVSESAWEFEKNGAERSFNYDKFYCLHDSPIKYINLIVKRKLVISEYNKLIELIPSAHFEREAWNPKQERLKGILLHFFLKYFPVKHQYSFYKWISKPVKID